jgi:hypothetical protein
MCRTLFGRFGRERLRSGYVPATNGHESPFSRGQAIPPPIFSEPWSDESINSIVFYNWRVTGRMKDERLGMKDEGSRSGHSKFTFCILHFTSGNPPSAIRLHPSAFLLV